MDAVIVGGGLTGCAAAYAFAAAGVRVVLVEEDRLGRGNSGAASGWIGTDPGAPFSSVQAAHGVRTARQMFQAWRRAALDLTALVRRLALKCDLQSSNALIVGNTPDQIARLERERKARRDAGLETAWLNARVVAGQTGLSATGAIGTREGGILDPYRATLGLAAAAAARGAGIFEQTPVRKVRFTRRFVDVVAPTATIRARKVVVATGTPTTLFHSLARHFWFRSSYMALTDRLPAAVRRTLGKPTTVVRDQAAPPHFVRWVDEGLLVSGADSPELPERQRPKMLVQRTGQLMYELSTLYPQISGIMPAYGWHTSYAATADGLPFVGPHRNYPHHLFALGDSSRTVTGAFLASRILLRHFNGELDPADEAFGFNR